MSRKNPSLYHSSLEAAVFDLVRVGSTGFASGVTQIATRMIRTTPSDVSDPETFRANLHEALKSASNAAGLRFAGGHLPTDDLTSSSLVEIDPYPDASHLVLNEREQSVLTDIALERKQAEVLTRAGIPLTRSVLFTGPPGVGKTLAARWLAGKLQLPLVVMSLSATVSSHLGSSGKNVKAVLDYAQSGPCVLFIDEFDAIAKNRDDDTDIGELKRIVNVVLMELDRWPSSSVLLAATNHEHLLDPAVRRRFDTLLTFDIPSRATRRQLFERIGQLHSLPSPFLDALADATIGATGSDIERLWNAASRRALLHDVPVEESLGEYACRFAVENGNVEASYPLLSNQLGWSNRRIAALAGVTHPTVASALRRMEQGND